MLVEEWAETGSNEDLPTSPSFFFYLIRDKIVDVVAATSIRKKGGRRKTNKRKMEEGTAVARTIFSHFTTGQ